MVWSGLKRADAAQEAGLADCSLRAALRKPHVLAHYSAELAALRTSLRARNLHRLDTIADGAEQHHRPGDTQSPGVCIVIVQPPAPRPGDIGPPMITIEPTPANLTP
jgi:hypothetical protein